MKRSFARRIGAGLLSISLVIGCVPMPSLGRAEAADVKEGSIVINGDDIKADNKNGLTFKGFGLLSGNSTSDLLMDYKAEHPEKYAELLQILFGGKRPIMNHVKMEMGNDRNTSTGPESATKRYQEEKANVLRNPGWQLAADAKKINPNLKVSILRWKEPAWVKTDEDIYAWYKETILDAYEQYGYMVDYINPNVNEAWGKEKDVAYTKKFAQMISQESKDTIRDEKALELYKKIKLIVSDEAGTASDGVAQSMKDDKDFYDAVDVVGYHYSPWDDKNGGMKWLAETEDKEVWNSEAQATFSNSAFRPSNNVKDPSTEGTGIGGTGSALEMGNTFIKGFCESRRSHVIYQPAIGSFYEGGQFSFKELVSARDPWSGWIHYDAGLLILSHLSKFAVTGWENEDNTAGIWRAVPQASKSTADGTNPVNGRNGGENYMTLASPAKDQFSTMIVNDSQYAMKYKIHVKNLTLQENQKLEVWETRAADDGAFNENYMKHVNTLSLNDAGEYVLDVKPYSAVTVTTLSDGEENVQKLPVEETREILDTDVTGSKQDASTKYLYGDDFEYRNKSVKVLDGKGGFAEKTEDYIASRGGDTGAMARYTHTMNGAFEVYKDSAGNHVLRQQLDRDAYGVGGAWNEGDPVTLIGDFRWMNYAVSADVMFETDSNSPYVAIGIRQTGSSQMLLNSSGYSFKVFKSGKWGLYRKGSQVVSGELSKETKFLAGKNQWNNIRLQGAGDVITAYVNGMQVASYKDQVPITSGRIALGSAYTFTQFDNLKVEKVSGTVPYYTELLDNMETYDLTQGKNPKLVYNDKWSHANGQGMYVYQRSMSTSKETGAALSYTFTGTGLEILGANKEACTLSVVVDGKPGVAASSQAAVNMNMAYRIQGLNYGKHTVTVEVQKGTLSVDMIGVLGNIYRESLVQPKPVVEKDLPKGSTVKVGDAVYVVADAVKKTVKYKKSSKSTLKSVTVPATVKVTVNGKKISYKVTTISASAFAKCKKLKRVVIGKNIKTIENSAMKNCKSLKTIIIKSVVLKSVGKNAIKGIHRKAIIRCGKKLKAYKKIFTKKTGYKKTMKFKK